MATLAELGEVQKNLMGRIGGRLRPKAVPGKPPAAPAGSGAPDWLQESKPYMKRKVDPNAASRSAKQVGTPAANPMRDTPVAPRNLTRPDPAQMRSSQYRRSNRYQPGSSGQWRTPGDWA